MEGLLEYTFLHMYVCFQAENQVKRILSFEVPAMLCCRYHREVWSSVSQHSLIKCTIWNISLKLPPAHQCNLFKIQNIYKEEKDYIDFYKILII